MEFKTVNFFFPSFRSCSVLLCPKDQTQRNQQKFVYRGRCLKRTNRKDKCWICTPYHELAISYSLYTNLDATEIMRTSEHAEGCRLDHQQLNELKRLAAEDPRPV
ncbi:hypothetical protein T4C_13389 [Trichinella pseudospiralis]|uniref:FLYWCH-type domain-containing protein n=1 Tax=Trichinella pseudospiralis TaxID=6337 RepID=A0A0V1JDA0_TRIPS|nr:hypothetical protein T4C_13389 [Trichinella pseudospiralis]